jgi:hypothetical protein
MTLRDWSQLTGILPTYPTTLATGAAPPNWDGEVSPRARWRESGAGVGVAFALGTAGAPSQGRSSSGRATG